MSKKYCLIMSQETWNQMKAKTKKLSRKTILKHFEFCLSCALAELGAHTGGPYEEEFKRKLFFAQRAYDSLREFGIKK